MIGSHVTRYTAFQRSLGKSFAEQAAALRKFASFADQQAVSFMTPGLVAQWAGQAASPNAARTRFEQARAFAIFLNAEDGRHEPPTAGLFGRGRRRRPTPHILAPEQIANIILQALKVRGRSPISPHTYHHLFGLMASTGLRISEVLAIQLADILEDGLLIRNGKFGKDRLVPLHPSVRAALDRYVVMRRDVVGAGEDLFVLGHGVAPTAARAHVVFVRLVRQLGYRSASGPGPRLHDLRHSFAVRSLEACAGNPQAVLRHMRALSTYLGHSEVAHTYWYLTATPVLLNTIASVAEKAWTGDDA